MLINQAKNLANLPSSSQAHLEQSIDQTEQLLSQAQRIAYGVTSVDQAFTQHLSAGLRRLDLAPTALHRRADALAELTRRISGRLARANRRGADPRQHANPDRRSGLVEPVSLRRPPGRPGRQPARRAPDQQLADLTAVMASIARVQSWKARAPSRTRPRPSSNSQTSSTTARATNPDPRRCSTDAGPSA